MNKIVFIVGPTCSSKTDISLALAEYFSFEIISADSFQVYKNMNIGTAKISAEDASVVQHHLLDIVEHDETFNVYEYRKKVLSVIADIIAKNKFPLIVGGSGLYIKALIDGLDEFGNNKELRNKLEKEADREGFDSLYERLCKLDKARADRIHKNDRKRIIRALEIVLSDNLKGNKKTLRDYGYDFIIIGLKWRREYLYQRANVRVDRMMQAGLLEEVVSLNGKFSNTSSQAVGYKELIAYLQGECSLDEAVSQIKRNTRRLIKKQFTWFNADTRIKWVDMLEEDFKSNVINVKNIIERFLF